MGNGQRPEGAPSDAEDWGDLLDEVDEAPLSGERPAGAPSMGVTLPVGAARLPPPMPSPSPSKGPPPLPLSAASPLSAIPPGSLPPPSTPLGLRGSLPPVAPRAAAVPPLPPRGSRVPTNLYGGSASGPPPPPLPPTASRGSVAPSMLATPPNATPVLRMASAVAPEPPSASLPPPTGPNLSDAQHALLGALPLRPSVPPGPRGALSVSDVWSDDDTELTFERQIEPAMPAWAHGSTTEFEPDDSIVAAIAAPSQPPPPPVEAPPPPSAEFVHFADDDLQFDPFEDAAPRRPTSAPKGSLTPPAAMSVMTPSINPHGPTKRATVSMGSVPPPPMVTPAAVARRDPPSAPELRWDDATPPRSLEVDLDDEIEPDLSARTPKLTPKMPASTLSSLLGEDLGVKTPVPSGASVPPEPFRASDHGVGDAHSRPTPPGPVQVPPEAKGSVHERPTQRVDASGSGAQVAMVDDEARIAMRERLAVEDFAGALSLADKLLEINRSDGEARRVAMRCREELRTLYIQRIGSLNQIPTTMYSQSQLRWLALDHRAGFVLSLIDGMSSIEDIIDVSTMPSLEVLRTVHNLLSENVISLRRPRR